MNPPEITPPPQVQKWLQDIREQEAAHFIAELVGTCQRILNVGPSWGRDTYFLSKLGKEVINFDLARQGHLAGLILGDITTALPFPDASFDAIILAEVLEHLIEDGLALQEARRVLRDQGRLIVAVPFFNDEPEFHVRIHSPQTIRRLLNANGFEINQYLERGGLITFPRLVHGVRKVAKFALSAEKYNQSVINADRFLARRAAWVLRFSPYFGCYLAATKSATADHRTLNIQTFRH